MSVTKVNQVKREEIIMDQIIVVSEDGKFKEHTTVQLKNSLTIGFDGDGNIVALRGAALYTDLKNNELYKKHILKALETWHHTIKPCGFKIPPELDDMMKIGMLSGGLISKDEKVQSETKTECESTTGEMKPCTPDDTECRSPYQATVEGMLSADYKERFKAEYQQTKIRYEKLNAFCNRIEAAMRTCPGDTKRVQMPEHDCPLDLLHDQLRAMGDYLHCLEIRAVIEGIEL
jgi:hypothetical protein